MVRQAGVIKTSIGKFQAVLEKHMYQFGGVVMSLSQSKASCMQLDESAAIIPGCSLGGLELGISIDSVAALTKDLILSSKHLGIKYYVFKSIIIGVEKVNNEIIMLAATAGYIGKLPDGTCIGIKILDMAANPKWQFDFEDGTWANTDMCNTFVANEFEDPDDINMANAGEVAEITILRGRPANVDIQQRGKQQTSGHAEFESHPTEHRDTLNLQKNRTIPKSEKTS